MRTALTRIGGVLGRIIQGPDTAEMVAGPEGPRGRLLVPNDGDGRFEVRTVQGRPCLTPDEASYYLYCVLPAEMLARSSGQVFVEVEYFGERHGQFRVQYASTDRAADHGGLYKAAAQLWEPEPAGRRRFRRALFPLPDFDAARTQNLGASFRLEFRSEMLVSRISVSLREPEGRARFTALAPLPELKKLPGRFYPINYLFVEITNACNFKCTWCPDDIMDRRRGFMKKEKVFRILDEIAAKRSWLGPLYPVKLHQMGEPMLHPELPAIVEYAESRGVPIELNTNCGLITPENIDALYRAGLTNLILSYQTPDVASFKTRKAPRISFEDYRDKVRLAVERKVALGARTRLEIDIMNTKYADGYRIVSEDEQAVAFIEDWVAFCEELERRYGVLPRSHDRERIRAFHFLDQDENGSRYELLDGVHLVWKRCHSWGNVIDTGAGATGIVLDGRKEAEHAAGHEVPAPAEHVLAATGSGELEQAASADEFTSEAQHPPARLTTNTYCPAPYDQFVIQWNGDVVACCTDYEGRTKTANVFASSIEEIWKGATLTQRKRDMLEGRLLDVCSKCMGIT